MKHIVIFSISILLVTASHAQQAFIMSYPIGFPMGDHSDYIGQTSFRGFSMEYLHRVKENLGVGLEASWSIFYEKEERDEYKQGTASITGIQYRYTNAIPLLAQAKYFLPSESKMTNIYLGLGVGAMYVNRSTDFGLYRITNEAWQFCLRPEAGIVFNIKPGFGLLAGVKYYAPFKSEDLDGQSYLSANVGLIFSTGSR